MKKAVSMSSAKEAGFCRLASTLSKRLSERGHVPFYAATAHEALEKVLQLIPPGASVGIPGSVSIREMGAPEALRARGNTVMEHWDPQASPSENLEARFGESQCDVLLTGSNAITTEGILVNIDGSGNRLAAMCWSRGDRIFVISMNKVCPGVEQAVARVQNFAVPPNALRLGCRTPCAVSGCHAENGCIGPDSLCRLLLVTAQAPTMPEGKKSYVILVGEPLGY